MGNRALIVFCDAAETAGAAVYLHWNGGPETVYAVLDYLASKGGMRHDVSYTTARFIQVVGNFLGGTMSLGVQGAPALVSELREQAASLSHGDNGIYHVLIGAGSYGMAGRYVDGAWWDADTIRGECLRAEQHHYRTRDGIMGNLASLNDQFFNR
jgi:hypothetical protein